MTCCGDSCFVHIGGGVVVEPAGPCRVGVVDVVDNLTGMGGGRAAHWSWCCGSGVGPGSNLLLLFWPTWGCG